IPDDTQNGERVGNRRPTVRITAGAASSDEAGIDYKVLFRWNGFDEDGLIAEYQFAIDDTLSENAWQDTTGFSALVRFKASTKDPRDQSQTRFTDWHTFFIRAVDNEFAVSQPDFRYFNARTIAPTSRVTFPITVGDTPQLQRTLLFRWDGEDIDSSSPDRKPVAYEFKLVRINEPFDPEPVIVDSLTNADNLLLDTLRVGSKKAWIRVPSTQRELRLDDLPVAARLAFSVRAVDEAGAIEPKLNKGRNIIAFAVTGTPGQPVVDMEEATSQGSFQFPTDGDVWELSLPTDLQIRFKWTGDASSYGSEPGNVNYALDIPDVEDESIRDPRGIGGWIGWGTWKELQTPFVFSTEEGGTEHHFWLKMRDISDSRESERLCHAIISVVGFSFERFALVVDDSRFQGVPSDADHDRFLDDTLLRRFYDLGVVDKYSAYLGSQENGPAAPEALPLATLAKYRNLVWHSQVIALGQTVPLYSHEVVDHKISAYLAAGGRLFMTGGRVGGVLNGSTPFGTFGYPKFREDDDRGSGTGTSYPFDSFIWEFLHMRNTLQSQPTDATATQREASGMISARSIHPAYPDIPIDLAKWNPYEPINGNTQFRGGIKFWEGVYGDFLPIEQIAGLDSLYTVVTMDTTYCCGALSAGLSRSVIAQRYESTRADTLAGSPQGRTMLFDFQPWYFDSQAITDAGTAAVNWLVTGKDH
ncbi:MAG: hypothetical protein KC729_17750, partial [Candidatus Eisenbacteria bacterium]|nr:hypothetical protein [Candidatus Eisenbacteria bacterium]